MEYYCNRIRLRDDSLLTSQIPVKATMILLQLDLYPKPIIVIVMGTLVTYIGNASVTQLMAGFAISNFYTLSKDFMK